MATGKYIDTTFGDTLQINQNNRYDYIEKLNTGNLGWTSGTWTIKKRKLHFKCDHKPLVGYRLRIRRDSSSNVFQLKLVQGEKETPIFIEDVYIFKNNFILSNEFFKKSNNIAVIATNDFDSIVVTTFNYNSITFHNTLNTNYSYIAKILPVERLYELDKVPFRINKFSLKSTQTNEYSDMNLNFKKIGN
jgi:hypothetical protein